LGGNTGQEEDKKVFGKNTEKREATPPQGREIKTVPRDSRASKKGEGKFGGEKKKKQ